MDTRTKRRLGLFQRADSLVTLVQWLWDRLYAFLLSGIGAVVMGGLARATDWISHYGPIAWGTISLVTFLGLYAAFITGRRVLATARRERAEALFREQTAEHATINPLDEHFRGKRVRLTDLYTPFGEPLQNRSFVGCELIGPAVIFLSPSTVFRRNTIQNVEFVRINQGAIVTAPNKIVIQGGTIENCKIYNTIILYPEEFAPYIDATFDYPVRWMNDPINATEAQKLQAPKDTELETQA